MPESKTVQMDTSPPSEVELIWKVGFLNGQVADVSDELSRFFFKDGEALALTTKGL